MGAFANLAPALVRLRKRRGLSQAAVAEAAGINASNLCKYERGAMVPGVGVLERILDAIGADAVDLGFELAGEEAKAPDPRVAEETLRLLNQATAHLSVLARHKPAKP